MAEPWGGRCGWCGGKSEVLAEITFLSDKIVAHHFGCTECHHEWDVAVSR